MDRQDVEGRGERKTGKSVKEIETRGNRSKPLTTRGAHQMLPRSCLKGRTHLHKRCGTALARRPRRQKSALGAWAAMERDRIKELAVDT